MGSHRRARRQDRAREVGQNFGRRHPRTAVILVSAALAGVAAICALQIGHGTYLGRSWLIAATAGMAVATAFTAAVLIRNLRHVPALGRGEVAWTTLAVLSASSIKYPFPLGRGPYSSVQAFFDVVHGALLGYAAVICAALITLFLYLLIRPRGLPALAILRQPLVRGLADETGELARRPTPQATRWPAWIIAAAGVVLVAGFILAAVGGPHSAAKNTAAGWLILLALTGLFVSVPVALYRRYRSARGRPRHVSLPGTSRWGDSATPGATSFERQPRDLPSDS